MGMSVYHPTQRWGPEDFYTGGDKPFASLANIPRQIFEGIQVREDRALKERTMADKERQTNLEAERNEEAKRQHEETMEYRRNRDEVLDKQFQDRLDAEDNYRNERLKLSKATLAAQIGEAKRNRTEKALIQSFLHQKQQHERSAAMYIVSSKDLFLNPEIQKEFEQDRDKMKTADQAIDMYQTYLSRYKDRPDVINPKAIAFLQPIIRNANEASTGFWMAQGVDPGNGPYDEMIAPQIKSSDYQFNVKGIDGNDPVVNAAIGLLAKTPEEIPKIKAALGAVIKGQKPTFINFDKHDFSRAKTALKVVMDELKKQKQENVVENKVLKKAADRMMDIPSMGLAPILRALGKGYKIMGGDIGAAANAISNPVIQSINDASENLRQAMDRAATKPGLNIAAVVSRPSEIILKALNNADHQLVSNAMEELAAPSSMLLKTLNNADPDLVKKIMDGASSPSTKLLTLLNSPSFHKILPALPSISPVIGKLAEVIFPTMKGIEQNNGGRSGGAGANQEF